MIDVRFFINSSNASCTSRSDSESKDDVASSNISMDGFFNSALAMAIRCRCPPESFTPRSPTIVSYPSGNEVMN